MKTTLKILLVVLMVAVVLLGILFGCPKAEPEDTTPDSTAATDGTVSTTGSTEPTDVTEIPTETTGSEPADNETLSSTEPTVPETEPITEPTTAPTTEPSTPATEPSTEPSKPATEPTKPSECAHKWGDWTVQKDATCDTDGSKSRTCSKCGNAETQTIPATGHNWDEGKMTTKPTNCSDMGVCTYTCLTCGKTKMTQVEGEHSFGSWKYEEYTYKDYNPDGSYYNTVSHRKVRSCTKCGYVEYGNTPDHHCERGSDNHKVTIVSEPTCSKRGVKRSTCTVCGWSTEFEYGETGNAHEWKKETKRLTEYTEYTNELDAVISTCKLCGKQIVSYKWGEGSTDYHRYRTPIHINKGTAYGVVADGETDWLSHPTWQTVRRGHVYDSDGYVKQFTVHWHDKSGNRYSQVIHCGKGEMEAWFAEFGMNYESPTCWQLKIQGGFIVPYKVSLY